MRTIRIWALIAAISAFYGCPGTKPAAPPEPDPAPVQIPAAKNGTLPAPAEKSNEIPKDVIDAIPALIAGLKPGMAREQVIEALRLKDFEILNTSAGLPQKKRFRYYLDDRHVMVLYFDCSRREQGEYLSAILAGEWAKAAEEATRPDADMLEAASASNGFAAGLYGRLRERRGNLFISPFSVFTAMAMARAGARGRTEEEMAAVLRLPADRGKFHKALGSVVRHLNSRITGPDPYLDGESPDEGKPEFELVVANGLFIQRGCNLLREFVDASSDDLGAGAMNLDFKGSPEDSRLAINAWVLEKTRRCVADILGPGSVTADTRVAVASAIHFIAPWDNPFEESATCERDFRTDAENAVKAPFMNAGRSYRFADKGEFRALAIPYRGNDLAMIVLLPKAVDGLAAVEAGLDYAAISAILEDGKHEDVILKLPKFKMASSFDMAEILTAMGMKNAFSIENADFSGIAGKKDLFLGPVAHKAFVAVDEKGTEAGAATVELTTFSGLPEKEIEFFADHPFLFLIADLKTKTVIFMGRVADPSK